MQFYGQKVDLPGSLIVYLHVHGGSNFSLVVQTSLILFSFVVGMLADLIQSKIVEKLEEFELQHISRRNLLKYFIILPGGEDEFWDRETMFSQLAKRSPCVVVIR